MIFVKLILVKLIVALVNSLNSFQLVSLFVYNWVHFYVCILVRDSTNRMMISSCFQPDLHSHHNTRPNKARANLS